MAIGRPSNWKMGKTVMREVEDVSVYRALRVHQEGEKYCVETSHFRKQIEAMQYIDGYAHACVERIPIKSIKAQEWFIEMLDEWLDTERVLDGQVIIHEQGSPDFNDWGE